MYAANVCEPIDGRFGEEEEAVGVLHSVASLREELNAMAADIRSVLSENARLKSELDEIRERGAGKQSLSEAYRMRDEIDRLLRLHESVSSVRPRLDEERSRQRSAGYGGDDRNAWMKKMMMFMMMSDLM